MKITIYHSTPIRFKANGILYENLNETFECDDIEYVNHNPRHLSVYVNNKHTETFILAETDFVHIQYG